jgi:hypothetical protein
MPFHWCYQETEALLIVLSSIPLFGVFFRKWHAKWHAKWKIICGSKCNDKGCSMLEHIPHGKVNEEECPQHPLIQIEDWDEVPVELIKEKFGEELVLKLRMHPLRLGLWDVPSENDFRWYLNGAGVPKAVLIHTMEFIYSHEYESWDDML